MTIPHWRTLVSSTALQACNLIAKELRNDLRHWSRGPGSNDLLALDTNEASVGCLLANGRRELVDFFISDRSSEVDDLGDSSLSGRSASVAAQPGLAGGVELAGADEGELCLRRRHVDASVDN